jgi:hypothetical protein
MLHSRADVLRRVLQCSTFTLIKDLRILRALSKAHRPGG